MSYQIAMTLARLDPQIAVHVDKDHGHAWYSNPLYIGIGVIILLLVVLISVSASRRA
jgi:hypothetical protein